MARRWNGWGDDSRYYPIPATAINFLVGHLGVINPLPDITLEQVKKKVPDSRLPPHQFIENYMIKIDAEHRIKHARGQSLPDWLAMRSGEFNVFPDGVAFPEKNQDLRDLFDYAVANNICVIPYGGGTSVVGHITPIKSDRPILTISLSHLSGLLGFDEESQIATFGAGTPGPIIEAELRARGYTLGHFPQSFELSTLGGWVASRSSGQQSLYYGRIENLFAGAHIETPHHSMDIPCVPASSAGPDLREIILGSEGRMGILSEVKVRVTKMPEKESFRAVFFSGWDSAIAAAKAIAQAKIPLSMLRLSNVKETEIQLLLAGKKPLVKFLEKALCARGIDNDKCILLIGITGSKLQHQVSLKEIRKIIASLNGVYMGSLLGKKWAEKRFRFPYMREPLWLLGYVVDTMETCMNWSNVNGLMLQIEDALENGLKKNGINVYVFSHLSHLYQQGSSIYVTYIFPVSSSYKETLENWQILKKIASSIIIKCNATISHQHGVGLDHAPYMVEEKGELGLSTIKQICRHFDPNNIMNPGKLFEE